jgi:hypothetical protein
MEQRSAESWRIRSYEPDQTFSRRGTDWAAIWGGVFVFAAVWTVFESLAFAIFSGANSLTNPQAKINAGMALWTIILTIIAMYVAGHETSKLAGFAARHDGLVHGMMMFGLVVVGAVALLILAGAGVATGASKVFGTHIGYLTSLGTEWTAFLSLLLGWLAAMWGGSNAVKEVVKTRQSEQMQSAA